MRVQYCRGGCGDAGGPSHEERCGMIKRIKVDFNDPNQLAAVVMAKFGMGNRIIQQRTGLTNGQITRRLRIAILIEGQHEKGVGYRKEWSLGLSQLQGLLIAQHKQAVEYSAKRRLTRNGNQKTAG